MTARLPLRFYCCKHNLYDRLCWQISRSKFKEDEIMLNIGYFSEDHFEIRYSYMHKEINSQGILRLYYIFTGGAEKDSKYYIIFNDKGGLSIRYFNARFKRYR
ncbi:hypothetical protein D3C78_798270 [compost metagenome]